MALYTDLRQKWGMGESLSDKEKLARIQQEEATRAHRERSSLEGYLSSDKWGPFNENHVGNFMTYQNKRQGRERAVTELQDRVTQQVEAEQKADQEMWQRRFDYTPKYEDPQPVNNGRRTAVRPQEQQYTPPQDPGRARLEDALRSVGGHYNVDRDRNNRPDLLQQQAQQFIPEGRWYGQDRDSSYYMQSGPHNYDTDRGALMRQLDMQDRITSDWDVLNNPSSHYGMEQDRPGERIQSPNSTPGGGSKTWQAILRDSGVKLPNNAEEDKKKRQQVGGYSPYGGDY